MNRDGRMRTFSVVLAVLLAGHGSLHAQYGPQPEVPEVIGTGTVEVILRPTRALILVTITGEGFEGSAAAEALEAQERRIRQSLAGQPVTYVPWALGFGENQQIRRMITGDQPVRTSRDVLARAGLGIEVADVAQVLPVFRLLAEAGVRTVAGVVYMTDESDDRVAAAVARATRLAHASAEQMAAALGGRVGPPLRVMRTGPMHASTMSRFAFGDPTGVPLHASDVVVRVNVQGTWRFVQE
jgi:hypothetical protein